MSSVDAFKESIDTILGTERGQVGVNSTKVAEELTRLANKLHRAD